MTNRLLTLVVQFALLFAPLIAGCGDPPCEGGILPDSEILLADAVGYFPWEVRVDTDGGFIIAGYTTARGATLPPLDMALIKLDATGSVRWTRAIDAGQHEEARGVLPTGDGGYIVVGYTGFPVYDLGLTQNEAQLLLLKLDSSGGEIWSQTIRVDTFTVGYSVCESADGAFVIAASAGETVPGDAGALLMKFDAEGTELWRQTYRSGRAFTPWDVIATDDGGYAMVGHTDGLVVPRAQPDVYVVKTDSEGIAEWDFRGEASLDFGGSRVGRGIVQTRDGGFAIAGTASNSDGPALFVVKLDGAGRLVWDSSVAEAKGYDLVEAPDGGIVVAGENGTSSFFFQCRRLFALRLSGDGAPVWSGRFAGDAEEGATAIALGSDGKYLLAGYTQSGVQSMRVIATPAGSEGTAEAP